MIDRTDCTPVAPCALRCAAMGRPMSSWSLDTRRRGPQSVRLYGFMTGVRSYRKLEAACREQILYPWLTGWQHPDQNTLR